MGFLACGAGDFDVVVAGDKFAAALGAAFPGDGGAGPADALRDGWVDAPFDAFDGLRDVVVDVAGRVDLGELGGVGGDPLRGGGEVVGVERGEVGAGGHGAQVGPFAQFRVAGFTPGDRVVVPHHAACGECVVQGRVCALAACLGQVGFIVVRERFDV